MIGQWSGNWAGNWDGAEVSGETFTGAASFSLSAAGLLVGLGVMSGAASINLSATGTLTVEPTAPDVPMFGGNLSMAYAAIEPIRLKAMTTARRRKEEFAMLTLL